MSILSLQNVVFDYGREPLLDGASLNLERGVRYALVGENGAGKSTLLSLLAGEIEPRGGSIEMSGGVRLDYLRQETTINQDATRDLFTRTSEDAFPEILKLEEALNATGAAIEAGAGDAEALGERLGQLEQEFGRLDGYTWRSRLEAALTGLGLGSETWNKLPRELSGGQRRRAALAAVLLRDSDLLLLDEPTNHLDLRAREWLESRLVRLGAGVIIVSHDRFFLDQTCTRTLHLDRGRVRAYTGNYSDYVRAARETRRQEQTAWRRQSEKIARTEDFIRRNLAGQKTKQAQSRRKQLEREETVRRPAAETTGPRISLEPRRTGGATALEASGVSKRYDGEALIRDFSLRVGRGERIGIIGPNGCGKTTLLRILAGGLLPDSGIVTWGHNADIGFYDQQLLNVTDTNTVLQELASVWPGATIGELRSFAGAFGFGADMIDRSVGLLSGGERGRLSLMRLVREGYNTLLLDEPTNHLDMRSRESLETALQGFPGTLVVISHDRSFLDRIIDKLLVFPDAPDDGPVPGIFVGNYSAWRAARADAAAASRGPKAERTRTRGKPGRDPDRKSGLSKNEIRRRRQLIAEAEARIAALEAQNAQLLKDLESPDLDPARRLEVSERIVELETDMSERLSEWEAWNDEIETN